MLRSTYGDLAYSRQDGRHDPQALVKRLLDTVVTDNLPRSLAETET